MSIELVMTSNYLIFWRPFSSHLQSFPASGSFLMRQFFASGGRSVEASASASVLPVNIQNWFPLGWTGWISLQSKGLSRVFSNTQFKGTNSSVLSFLYRDRDCVWLIKGSWELDELSLRGRNWQLYIFLSDQCKEREENNRTGKTRDLFKKIRDTKGTFHAKMGTIKDRNDMDLTEA